MQLRVFAKTSQSDRSLKFIRAAYTWLLISMAMLPSSSSTGCSQTRASPTLFGFVPSCLHGGLRQLHDSGRGVARGADPGGRGSSRVSSLWGPFILLNVGCAGRVVLQILTDFIPRVAFPLVGVTGFIEVAALAWWGVELWHTMNLSILIAPNCFAPRCHWRHVNLSPSESARWLQPNELL